MKAGVEWTCSRTGVHLCSFFLSPKPRDKAPKWPVFGKTIPVLFFPLLHSQTNPKLLLPGRAPWLCTEWSRSSQVQGHLHHCSALSHLQASCREIRVAFTLESVFSKSPSDTFCKEGKTLSYCLIAVILSKVQREPRFFQLIRYLSSYIYVTLHTSSPSTFP